MANDSWACRVIYANNVYLLSVSLYHSFLEYRFIVILYD